MKKLLSVLELKLARVPANYIENLKQKRDVSVKKMRWKIVKIITNEGIYIPKSTDNDVFLVMTKKKTVKPSNKRKSK